MNEEGAFASFGDRDNPAIFATAHLLYPNDVGAHVTQETRTIRARDVASEVEHSDAFQNLGLFGRSHPMSYLSFFMCWMRRWRSVSSERHQRGM